MEGDAEIVAQDLQAYAMEAVGIKEEVKKETWNKKI